jgi:Casein kinase II regulatory subunit
MGADTVKIFCPKCQCVYHPPPIRSRSSSSSHNNHGGGAGGSSGSAGVDGAAFGTTFPHLFLMTFSNLVPDPLPPNSAYVPRVFGFRVHMSARQRTPSSSNSTTPVVATAASITAAVAAAAASADQPSLGKAKSSSRGEMSSRSNNNNNNKTQEGKPSSINKAESDTAANNMPSAEEGVEVTVGGKTFKMPTAATETKAESINGGEFRDVAIANPQTSIAKSSSIRSGGSNKRRSSEGEDNSSTAAVKQKEGNGFLVDNSSAKRRKRSDG